MLKTKFRIAVDTAKNFFSKRELTFISEAADWTILNVCLNVSRELNGQKLISSRVSTSSRMIRSRLAHFGSIHAFLANGKPRELSSNVLAVATWFHVLPEDPNLRHIASAHERLSFVHTACRKTKSQIASAGVPEEKIVVIPLGVNTKIFRRARPEERNALRFQLGIGPEKVVVGSFQKDGEGFGDGLKPKLIKGPDIFVDAVSKLSKKFSIHVLLTGPARGYVKRELESSGIPFTHIPYVKDANAIAPYYRALDLYLASARIEGGPMQIFEAWACGVPYVAVEAGLISDVATHGQDAMIVPTPDAQELAKAAEMIIEDQELANSLVKRALESVKSYDWSVIAKRYYEELYQPILKK